MNYFKTVNYTTEKMDEENLKVIVFGSCMQTDLLKLAEKLTKECRWVHVYNGADEYDFSWNRKIGYSQMKKLEIIDLK